MTHYCNAVWRCRYFWLSLVKMDLHHRYRGSLLGIGWSLLQPLALTFLFTFLFSGLFGISHWNYALFVLTGLAFWTFLHSTIVQGCRSFLQGELYIRQYPAPLAIYPLRTTLGGGFHLLVALCLSLIAGIGINSPSMTTIVIMLSLIPALCLMLIFGWAISTVMGLANVFLRDTAHLCEVGLQVLFYLTPVMYPRAMLDQRGLGLLADCNPMVPFLDLLRDPLVHMTLPSAMAFGKASIVTGGTFAIAILALKKLEKKLIFRL